MQSKIDISEAEYEVMLVLWNKPELTSKLILENLDKAWQLTTLNTLLNRLVKKQVVAYTKSGREYIYHPLVAKEHYVEQESQDFVQKLFGGSLSPLVAHFSKSQKLQQKDIDALKKLIEEWEDDND
ncbi:BlaI family transcriptional regulator, penicillinase repressor [Marisediminitalea aggregata]|jgi:predicted transcriptional regulator|uniref:BlaI family transcriptional regulator, penicillinase repressor n=1 Tax=Marisediminitalea aggregata TaxID=634436 RepID=A0A1M5KC87_9ALTE|nr:BlaI/MecI/CopY family transcriptional regulator [Marisediminitalea aggregata]MAH55634.1 CopY family transcriptional repressor [Aestuariibacter sp.]MAP22893.1 CopY family transcriptional repressor [Alteromonadaceae bacterium]HBY39263.1 BlaI/MecI/CopY family transcriptional regulator [Alteromonas sp.]MAX42139.1 CopY family transcriptional repressor [Alteromonadaceae bacterium]SHG49783.1 BlaI family transcriptional regulator, penicillinase repressor [Marisediminitalea aggregata]|tara:strand:- start:1202 stop:1579 length:378 start_codon:yes stop_codon:yes gene_type:complete